MIAVAATSGLFAPDELDEVVATVDSYFDGSSEGDRWLISTRDGRCLAVAYYAPERMAPRVWNLYLLAVRPDAQGQGIGSALVACFEQQLGDAGARVLLIETSGTASFAGQRAFYARLGYTEEARIRDFYAPADDKVVFWKRLLSGPLTMHIHDGEHE